MPLGGLDAILIAPTGECVGDLILRVCRRFWPDESSCFQDALDEVNVFRLDDPWVWLKGTSSKEFFVYRDEEAVSAWEDGPTCNNANTMFHFIIGDPLPSDPRFVEVAFAFDKHTPEVGRFIRDLTSCFLSTTRMPMRDAA